MTVIERKVLGILNVLIDFLRYFMSNDQDQESPIIIAIRDAAYSDLYHLSDLYERTEDIDNCLPLMQPDNFRQIVLNAAQQLSEICLEVIEEIYEDCAEEFPNAQISNLRPSFRQKADLKKVIVGNMATFEREINHYESCYKSFIERVENYEEQLDNNAYGAGAIGGVVGSVLLGPIGAVIGGMAAGAFIGNSVENEMQEYIQKLCNHFAEVFDKVNDKLQDMAERSFDFIINYNEQLEKRVSQHSLIG